MKYYARRKECVMPYRTFESALDSSLERINASLPQHFTSSDFIKVAKDTYPNEYAAILQMSNYRTLHTWVARWYLNRHYTQVGDKDVKTTMGHNGRNKLWEKR